MLRKLLGWMYKYSRWVLPCASIAEFVCILHFAWTHDFAWIMIGGTALVIALVGIHIKRRPPRDDDQAETAPPDTPFGDAIDRWLRQKERVG